MGIELIIVEVYIRCFAKHNLKGPLNDESRDFHPLEVTGTTKGLL